MTCFYNPKWRNYRTPTKKDILVFWHQITLFPLSHVWALTRGCPCWTYKRVQEKFRQDGWWIYNRMDYPWRFQHLQPKGTQQSWGQVWVTVLNQHSISLPSTVTHMLPICSFGKWKWEKPEDDATISHQLHSPLWSPLRVPVIAGQSDRHRRTRRWGLPQSLALHSSGGRGEEIRPEPRGQLSGPSWLSVKGRLPGSSLPSVSKAESTQRKLPAALHTASVRFLPLN